MRVNAIAPGAVLLPDEWDDATPASICGRRRRCSGSAVRDDVVEAVLYLLRADYVTGETIIVDGGRHVRH